MTAQDSGIGQDTSIRSILPELAKAVDRKEQEVEPLISKLEANWIITLSQVAKVEEAFWKDFGFPHLFVIALKARAGQLNYCFC